MGGDQTVRDHLVQMDGQCGLGLAHDTGQFGERQVPVLEFGKDATPHIVRYLHQPVLGIIQLEISEWSVVHSNQTEYGLTR